MTEWDDIIEAIAARAIGKLNFATVAYVTRGGTYVIASSPKVTDDGKLHDLVAILRGPINGTRVIPLRINVNDRFVEALKLHFDLTPERKEENDSQDL